MHEANEPPEIVGIGLRHDAVSEIEDVPRPALGAPQDVLRLPLDPLPRAEQERPVQVPLDASVVADTLPGEADARSSSRCASPVAKWIVGTSTASSTLAE